MMNWAYLFFGLLTVVAVVGVALDEVRARITNPGKPSPLSGMSFGDALLIALFVVPSLLGIVPIIHSVLTR